MQNTEEKQSYHATVSRLQGVSQRIGHKLSLALSEQQDAELWEKYQAVMEEWREVEQNSGHAEKLYEPFWNRTYYRPIFDEAYIDMTKRLAALYQRRGTSETNEEYREINSQIQELRALRKKTAKYVLREPAKRGSEDGK